MSPRSPNRRKSPNKGAKAPEFTGQGIRDAFEQVGKAMSEIRSRVSDMEARTLAHAVGAHPRDLESSLVSATTTRDASNRLTPVANIKPRLEDLINRFIGLSERLHQLDHVIAGTGGAAAPPSTAQATAFTIPDMLSELEARMTACTETTVRIADRF